MSDLTPLLHSPDPLQRRRGLKHLRQQGDADALRHLAAFFKRETDADLRTLAAQYGREIKAEMAASVPAPIIDAPPKHKTSPASAPKRKADLRWQGDVTWGTAITDLGLYFAVMVAIGIAGVVLSTRLISANNAWMLSLRQQTLVQGIASAVLMGAALLLFQVLYLGVIHLIARYALQGHATWREMIHETSRLHIAFALMGGALGLMFNAAFSSLPMANAEQMARGITDFFGSPQFLLLSLGGIALVIGYHVTLAVRLGAVYAFGWGKGCLTLIVWNIVMTVIGTGLYFVVILGAMGAATSQAMTRF